MRTRFIETLTALAAEDPRITLVVGDLGYSVVEDFAARYPGRFFNAGVAEQNMTGMAAGLAMVGRVVFTYSIANFPTLRCLEQIRNDVCYHNLPVKVVTVGAGYAYGAHGYTHHGLEDIAAMRALPHMAVTCPADSTECEALTRWLAQDPGPGYLRMGRNREPVLHTAASADISPGRLPVLREGGEVVILATGSVLIEALGAADALARQGVQVGVASVPFIKPLPREALLSVIAPAHTVVTLEEHCGFGGLGSAVAEVLAEHPTGARLIRRHAPERVDAIGDQPYMRQLAGLDAASLTELIQRVVSDHCAAH